MAQAKKAERVYKMLVHGTMDYARKNGFKKAILGLSGGVDSALVASIAACALGRGNVVALSMPTRFSSAGARKDAKEVAANLRIKFLEIPIQGLFENYLKVLGGTFFGKKRTGKAVENIQARIRANLLMAFSNRFGYLVLASGNKSELATGYCTLYGDLAGGFAIISDVPKLFVYKLARYVNKSSGADIIPESVIRRVPSAELAPGQKDSDTLPPYEKLDRIIEEYMDKAIPAEKIRIRGISKGLVKKVVKMIDAAEFKRRQAPVGIKIKAS